MCLASTEPIMSVTCAVRLTRAFCLSTSLLCALLASGCTTLKAVQEVGKQAAEGNVLTAAYTATIGVAVAAIVDVVTLGGAVSPEEGMGLISAAAAASKGDAPPPVTPTPPAAASRSAGAGTRAGAPASGPSTAAVAPAASATRTTSTAPAAAATVGPRPDAGASECIRVVPPTSRMGYFRIENSCAHPVEVAYCSMARFAANSLCRQRVHRTQAGEIAAYHHARVLLGPRSGKDLPVESDADAVYAGACRTSFGDTVVPHLTGVAPLTGSTLVRCIGTVGPRDAPVVAPGTR